MVDFSSEARIAVLERRADDLDKGLSGFRELDREVGTLGNSLKSLGRSIDELRDGVKELAGEFEAEKEAREQDRRDGAKEKRGNRLVLGVAVVSMVGTFGSSLLAVLMTNS